MWWCSMSLSDRYDVIAPHSETYILQRPSKVFICQVHKIIIYDLIYGVTGANKLRKRYPWQVLLSLSQPKEWQLTEN
jgi:hypothetical protein